MTRIESLEEIRHAEKNQKLCFWVEAIRVVDSCEDVHEHPVVWSLIEVLLLRSMLLIKYFTNELKHLCHNLVLIEAEHRQKNHNELHEAVDVSKVKSVRWSLLMTFVSIHNRVFDGSLDAGAYHDFAEADDAHSSEICKQSIDLPFLVFLIVNVGHNHPLDEELFQICVIRISADGHENLLAELANLPVVRHALYH